jgi:hypothetical protein
VSGQPVRSHWDTSRDNESHPARDREGGEKEKEKGKKQKEKQTHREPIGQFSLYSFLFWFFLCLLPLAFGLP